MPLDPIPMSLPADHPPAVILSSGERNCNWIEKHCRVPEGKHVGRSVVLRPWQRDIIRGIYGTPTRTAIISFGRKNGKTSLSAFLVLLHLCGPEAKHQSQLYSSAQTRDQASVLFKLAAKCVRQSPTLYPYVKVGDTAKTLDCTHLGTTFRALSADASANLGLSTAFVVHDELGQVEGPISDQFEALETAAGAHDDPLSVIISTQAATSADLLSLLIDDALKGHDPLTKLFLWTASQEDYDWDSDEAMHAANPALGDFLNETEVRRRLQKAKDIPARQSAYRNKHLNQRVSPVSPFIPPRLWRSAVGEVDLQLFALAPKVYLALDLSARNDLTALAAIADDEDGVTLAHVDFFAPLEGIKERQDRDNAPYVLWREQGFLTCLPGATVDYDAVAARLIERCTTWRVVAIAFDRWHIDVLKAALTRQGHELPLVEHGQGYKDMAPACDAIESALLARKLRHADNPILNWCAANAMVIKDAAGNRKLDKSKSTGRIDGLQVLTMALGQRAKNAAGQQTQTMPDDYELLVA